MAGYEIIEGIKCYAPSLAYQNDDFPPESFDELFAVESKNFWFVSRNKIIKRLVKKYLDKMQGEKKSFLEIGCGTAFVLKGLSDLPGLELSGAEIYLQGLKYARRRLPDVNFIQLDATNIPFKNEYNAIGAFDVLEHIEQDELVMQNVYEALKTGGYFFISVPQYMWMWSKTDDYACHKRRYSKKELTSKLRSKGFQIEYATSFVFTLFPLMMISRFFSRKQKGVPDTHANNAPELKINPVLNTVFGWLMKVDELLIKAGLRLPFGGSLVIVAKK
jgi:SAM-dependent methyltransferase